MARATRSPNYPALNLTDAIAGVKKVYEIEGRRRTSQDEVAKALGYKGMTGTSRSRVSALRKYGLMEPDGDGLRVSDDALSLLELPRSHPEHVAALRNAAFRPALFAELYDTYEDNIPSDNILRHFLIKKNFNPKVADEVVQVFRDTIGLVSREMDDYTAAEEPEDEQQEAEMKGTANVGGAGVSLPADQGSFTEYLTIPIRGRKVRLLVDGDMTQEVLNTLGRHLRLLRDDLPSDTPERPDDTDTEKDSVIAKDNADSLLDGPDGQ